MLPYKTVVTGWGPTGINETSPIYVSESYGQNLNTRVAVYIKDRKATASGLNYRVVGSFDGGTTWVGLTPLGSGATTGGSYALTGTTAGDLSNNSGSGVFLGAPMVRVQASALTSGHIIDIYMADM